MHRNLSKVNRDFGYTSRRQTGLPTIYVRLFNAKLRFCARYEEEEDDEQDESEEESEEADSALDEEGRDKGFEKEIGPPLLTPLSEDAYILDSVTPAWTARQSSALQPDIAVALIRSNLWPGAFTFAANKLVHSNNLLTIFLCALKVWTVYTIVIYISISNYFYLFFGLYSNIHAFRYRCTYINLISKKFTAYNNGKSSRARGQPSALIRIKGKHEQTYRYNARAIQSRVYIHTEAVTLIGNTCLYTPQEIRQLVYRLGPQASRVQLQSAGDAGHSGAVRADRLGNHGNSGAELRRRGSLSTSPPATNGYWRWVSIYSGAHCAQLRCCWHTRTNHNSGKSFNYAKFQAFALWCSLLSLQTPKSSRTRRRPRRKTTTMRIENFRN